MKKYLWETHLHTRETSACAQGSAADMVRAYKSLGFHGVIITDHFVNANCVMPRTDPWQKRIDGQLLGYTAAKRAGDALGIAVLPGFEYYHEGADYLTFGITEPFLRDQPDLCDIPFETYAKRVRDAGGFLIQAHPFRNAWYIRENVRQRWDVVDAFETVNGSHAPEHLDWDELSRKAAAKHGLIMTGGSDAHSVGGSGRAATAFDAVFSSAEALIAALRAGEGEAVRLLAD